MIWIGTSGWVYKHWNGLFYPRELPQRDQLRYFAQHFPTVEINRSFYRLPTREQFSAWVEQTSDHPDFLFAVKASRYLTHIKRLREPQESLERLVSAAEGLGEKLGPFLYQLPPKGKVDAERLEQFIAGLPKQHYAAFEFRDPTWMQPQILDLLERSGCALVVAIGGALPTPLTAQVIGPFSYIRIHWGAHGIGLNDDEIAALAEHIIAHSSNQREVYVYFNNDPDGHAIYDAQRLRTMLEPSRLLKY